jgi:hypothetical protein
MRPAVVGPNEPDGMPAVLIHQRDDLLVDAADEDHLGDAHRLFVGDAHAADEPRADAEPVEHLVDLRTAAVHDHRVHADELEQHDVLRERLLELVVGHRVAAVLDDDGLAVKAPDVGQRLVKNRGFVDQVVHGPRRLARFSRRASPREGARVAARGGGRVHGCPMDILMVTPELSPYARASRMADTVAIMDAGRILACGPVDTIKSSRRRIEFSHEIAEAELPSSIPISSSSDTSPVFSFIGAGR